ncbi:MAG: hypothetical protein LUD81_08360 [Clostridiales bacterium]|nr:hypothetical protein [Clostridiales bacterium]
MKITDDERILSACSIYKMIDYELDRIRISKKAMRRIASRNLSDKKLLSEIDSAAREAYKLAEYGDYTKSLLFAVILHKKVTSFLLL